MQSHKKGFPGTVVRGVQSTRIFLRFDLLIPVCFSFPRSVSPQALAKTGTTQVFPRKFQKTVQVKRVCVNFAATDLTQGHRSSCERNAIFASSRAICHHCATQQQSETVHSTDSQEIRGKS